MKHLPIFMAVEDRRIVIQGDGSAVLAKLRLLLKTSAQVHVFAVAPDDALCVLAFKGKIHLHRHDAEADDLCGAVLAYAAAEDNARDEALQSLARDARVPFNWVDCLKASEFITPAIVDRDPVTIAIGTEGTAPVLARKLKKDIGDRLPKELGILARIAAHFRPMAEALPVGLPRRQFWSDYFFRVGPSLAIRGERPIKQVLTTLLRQHLHKEPTQGFVMLLNVTHDDPELLTIKAQNALHEADVIIHDPSVPSAVLELARREAHFHSTSCPEWVEIKKQVTQRSHVLRLINNNEQKLAIEASVAQGQNIPCDVLAFVPSTFPYSRRVAA